jgi:hypothetical protein
MTYPLIRLAKVTNVDDPDKLGKVQVRILPELNGVANDSDLPWASPDSQSKTGKSEGVGFLNIPDLDSVIKVRIANKYWTSIYYLEEAPRSDETFYDNVISELDIEELTAPTYPQPKLEKTKDGSIFFHNTETGDIGIQHHTGLYVIITADGSLYVRSLDKIVFKTGEFQIGEGLDNVALFTPLEEVLSKILTANVICPSGPSQPLQESNGTPLSSLKSKLKGMKSKVSKTD